MIECIDTHAHLNDPGIAQVASMLRRAAQAGITRCLTVGTELADSAAAVQRAERFAGLWATVGIHPHHADTWDDQSWYTLRQLARENEKVVAIGEMGLDYHYNYSRPDQQKDVFKQQLIRADDLELPVIVHCRESFDDCLAMLDERGYAGHSPVIFHCFSEDEHAAADVLARGCYVSFSGTVTYKNAHTLQRAAMVVPDDRILLETDCPYLSPEPVRKVKPNEPALMVHTLQRVAELRGCRPEYLAGVVWDNARAIFGMDADERIEQASITQTP